MEAIPVFDLAPYRDASPTGRKALAGAVDSACREVGFLVVKGHGIPAEFIDDLFAQARGFYTLPLEEKLRYMPPQGAILRGYAPMKSQNLARSKGTAVPPDLRESFLMGRPNLQGTEHGHEPQANAFYQPNVWPVDPPAFKDMYVDYFGRMEVLAGEIMGVFAHALGLEETWFDDKIDDHFGILNTIHYPALEDDLESGQLRAGAHTDFGSLTILTQTASAGGLEVRPRNGDWDAVPPLRDAFIINIGDLMAQWTNDRWVSTLHRVANPSRSAARQSRQSLGFFCHPNYDAMVECIPTCRSGSTDEHYAAIRAGDYMRQKIQAVRGHDEPDVQHTSRPTGAA